MAAPHAHARSSPRLWHYQAELKSCQDQTNHLCQVLHVLMIPYVQMQFGFRFALHLYSNIELYRFPWKTTQMFAVLSAKLCGPSGKLAFSLMGAGSCAGTSASHIGRAAAASSGKLSSRTNVGKIGHMKSTRANRCSRRCMHQSRKGRLPTCESLTSKSSGSLVFFV